MLAQVQQLQRNTKRFRAALGGIAEGCGFTLLGGADSASPLVHIRLVDAELADVSRYDQVVEYAKSKGILITVATYNAMETNPPPTSLRISISTSHTEAQIDACAQAIGDAFNL